ncbi:UNVERIFIED_CONTAM: Ubiquitin-like domain-containing protein CIP73 [Sesamum calycinum]|uniref:Ubiquitin-like domain-containing protein CIP73 n=1 Tax=Sesamum calycinum TaxID=2727403 RepID=A0AAW2QWW3_9LAMI
MSPAQTNVNEPRPVWNSASTLLNKMGSNGGEHIKVPANDTAECSETTVEIKIKTLDSQTFTLRVDKCGRSNAIFKLETSIATGVLWSLAENFVAEMAVCVQREGNSKGEDVQVPVPELKEQNFTKHVPVPELKEQIASVTGVLSEQQRLICRGKVLKDDQLLSAYHVEDGHTLHLVVRQPVALSSELSDHAATDPASSTGLNRGNRVGPGMVVGTFNISEQGDGAFPDLNRIVSAVLNSFGVTRYGSGSEAIDLNQPPLERLSTAPGLSSTRNSSRLQSDQAASVAVPVEALQSPADALVNAGPSVFVSSTGPNPIMVQDDGNPDWIASPHHRRGPESPPSSKRQRFPPPFDFPMNSHKGREDHHFIVLLVVKVICYSMPEFFNLAAIELLLAKSCTLRIDDDDDDDDDMAGSLIAIILLFAMLVRIF